MNYYTERNTALPRRYVAEFKATRLATACLCGIAYARFVPNITNTTTWKINASGWPVCFFYLYFYLYVYTIYRFTNPK